MNKHKYPLCNFKTLRELCPNVLIVRHNEDTRILKNFLINESFTVDEVCGPYTTEQLSYSAAMRCFVNHANAWRIVSATEQPTIIVEADFVPVKGFGNLIAPVPPDKINQSLVYLYSVGPQIWDLAIPSCARGHGGGMVALVIFPSVARLLLDFFDEEIKVNPFGEYSAFDAKVGYWLKRKGLESYIPYRHYGEHGGIGNPEHRKAGLGRPHQADVLQERLAFMPSYAKQSRFILWRTRLRARVWGMLRLLAGRYLAWHDFMRSERWEMIRFAVGRFLFQKIPSN